MDIGLTWFRSQVLAEEATAIRSDTNQHVAGAHASVIRTSLRRGEDKVAWISGIEFGGSNEFTFVEAALLKIEREKSSSDNT